jgi:hypothetical protein
VPQAPGLSGCPALTQTGLAIVIAKFALTRDANPEAFGAHGPFPAVLRITGQGAMHQACAAPLQRTITTSRQYTTFHSYCCAIEL